MNEHLYKRFDVEIDLNKIQRAFVMHVRDALLASFRSYYDDRDDRKNDVGYKIRHHIFEETYEDPARFTGLVDYISKTYHPIFLGFREAILNTQIFLDVAYRDGAIDAVMDFVERTKGYIKRCPILGIRFKIYKSKAPQIYLGNAKILDEKLIDHVLGILEDPEYKSIDRPFSTGLKELLGAQNQEQLKDVLEDMLTALDETAKIILANRSAGIKHIRKQESLRKFGIKKHCENTIRNLEDWMNSVKHGTEKNFMRDEVEFMVYMTANIINFLILRFEQRP